MRPVAAMVAALLTAGLTTPASSANAASSQHRSHPSQHHTTAQPPARIACTVVGCQPIPAACTPVNQGEP